MKTLHTTLVHIHLVPGTTQEFLTATLANQQGTHQEPGNIAFDILQDPNNPDNFILYEVFADSDASAAHKRTPHYLSWRDTVAPLMAQPRKGVPYLRFEAEEFRG
ncbi:MAG: antibiotic biosynthesis monooxygenase [Spirochaetales bacterium]|nr:antibiotic biosynthesis monooxygenase [Spirochaetales bacterium]